MAATEPVTRPESGPARAPADPAGRSPGDPGDPAGRSPGDPADLAGRSPGDPADPVGRSPGDAAAGPVRTPPADPAGRSSVGPVERLQQVANRRKRFLEDGGIIALAVVVAILVRAFVAQAYWIPSASMEPQLNVNDRVVVSRLAYHLHAPDRGDIVVFRSPPGVEPPPTPASNDIQGALHDIGVALGFAQDQTVLIKRVIGLPGETVQGMGGHIYINGELLVEPYLPKGTYTSDFGPYTVPAGEVWVMGDNRGNSTDSRVFKAIPESSIVGRAIWKVWPVWVTSFL